jgi:ribosomal subunit interface protein
MQIEERPSFEPEQNGLIRGVELALRIHMPITLSGTNMAVTESMRTYAEYRFFKSVVRHSALVRSVHVTLSMLSERAQFQCAVTIDLGPSGYVTIRARGRHATAAIDRAAERTASLLDRRPTTSSSP